MNETERDIIDIITISGESKSLAFEALKLVKTKEFDKARGLMKEARDRDLKAHNIQTKIIQESIKNEEDNSAISLLMIHAQDHYMTSQLAKDMIDVLITLFEEERKEK